MCVCVAESLGGRWEGGAWHVYGGHYFPHTGSPTLRQMENRKGEQGGNSAYSGLLLQRCTHHCVCVCVSVNVGVCTCVSSPSVRSSSQAALTFKWDRQSKD